GRPLLRRAGLGAGRRPGARGDRGRGARGGAAAADGPRPRRVGFSPAMPRIHFRLRTPLAPAAVIGALTDFSPRRAEVWPNVDAAHFELHRAGPDWADVTEGSSVAGGVWERNRYQWDAEAGRVTATTVESNT